MEAIDDNGTTYEIRDALTTATQTSTSDLTFTFLADDLTPTSIEFTVIPSNDTETYYFDYLPTTQYVTKTAAEWIAYTIGKDGIDASLLSQGTETYDTSIFEWMPLDPGTEYVFFVFGYDAETKSATTAMSTYEFTTPTGKEPATDAYKAWLGTWTVTSTSSEKLEGTPVSFDVTFSQRTANISYNVTGWGITNYQKTGKVIAALKEDGGFRIKNMQVFAQTAKGNATFVGRYYKSETGKYAMATALMDALLGTLDAGGQSATIAGNTFTVGDDPTVRTFTAMDFYDDRSPTGAGWYSFAALTAYSAAGNPVGPYTMTKKSDAKSSAISPRAVPAPGAVPSGQSKIMLAKKARLTKALAPTTSSAPLKRSIPAMSSVLQGPSAALRVQPASQLRTQAPAVRSEIRKAALNK